MKVLAIIQARMGSTRLPNKTLICLNGHAIIDWVVKRVQHSKLLDEMVVAIPVNRADDVLEKHLERLPTHVFRGNENNVINRFYEAAKKYKATHIVRICADNPLIAGDEIDNLINFYFNNPCDYAYNHIPKNNNYPDGLGAEIISFELLEYMEKNAVQLAHRENCLSYITDNSEKYTIATFDPLNDKIAFPELKFDLDTFEDYYYLSQHYYTYNISTEELVQLYKKNR